MEQFNEIFQKQESLGRALTDLYSKFKRGGRKLSDLQSLSKYRQDIEIIFTEFSENNETLQPNFDLLKDEKYFTESYFSYIKLFYDQMVVTINLKKTSSYETQLAIRRRRKF